MAFVRAECINKHMKGLVLVQLLLLWAVVAAFERRISLPRTFFSLKGSNNAKTGVFLRNSEGRKIPLRVSRGHCLIPKAVKRGVYDLYIEEEEVQQQPTSKGSKRQKVVGSRVLPVYIPQHSKHSSPQRHSKEVEQLSFEYDSDAVEAKGKIIFLHVNKRFAKELFGESFELSKDGKKSIYFDSSAPKTSRIAALAAIAAISFILAV